MIEQLEYITILGILSIFSYTVYALDAFDASAQVNNSTLLRETLSNPLVGTPLIISNVTGDAPNSNDTVVIINAINPILGNLSVAANFTLSIPLDTCRDYFEEPKPTLNIYGVSPQLPLRTNFVENRPIYISFTFTNNADRPISGQIYGGENPYGIVNLEKGRTIIDTIQTTATFAGKNAPLATLVYYDNCSPISGEFKQPTVTAQQRGDIHARYYVTLNNFFAEEARSPLDDTITVGLSGKTGDQEYEKSLYVGDVGDLTQKDVNLRIGPFDIVPEDLRYLSFQYIIVNSGDSDTQKVLSVAADAATGLASTAFPAGAIAFGAVNQALLQPILESGRCDGTVVADKIRVPALTLDDWTNPLYATGFNSHSETRYYPGSESATFCGTDSRYFATWTIERSPFEE